jgi:prepilin-type N-terminal cleavage/methylation domain-containing protein
MKLFSAHNFYSQKGFTLIELLVVIGILGILAAALVATIDPFEQLKKAQDANVKNATAEFVTANIRYYTTHNNMPWTLSSNGGAQCAGTANPSSLTLSSITACITPLLDDGELKSGFTTVNSVLKEIVFSGNDNGVTACFKPQSKSQQEDLNTRYNIAGAITTGCKSQTSAGGNDCYWCTQ